ncbi:immunoglobulin superfamily member 10 [Ambystoma mexicanum]|uniref:immunoglobulin superfamily member 10 n=1 Tax=Ambystoma mexicanum TaxID=8296 RepID=UPI0037E75758
MSMWRSQSPSALPRSILGSCLFVLLLLPSHGSACPRPCACYVPTEVHCTFRYLTTIPRQIATNVERINLGYNSLVELTEHDFPELNKLELLMLHSNEIQRIHEKAFQDLHSLQVLKMSYNKVRSLHKNTFQGLKSLIRLHMDHNKIEFLNPEVLYGLTSLKLVHLEGNSLTQLHSDTFVTLRYMQIFKTSSIKHIYMSDNLLSTLPKDMFSYLPELETVYLNGNPWSCDCQLQWFAKWAEESRDIIKCKRDRTYSGGQQCPVCSNPRQHKGKYLSEIPAADMSCVKPTIDASLKLKNAAENNEGDFTSISPKDFIAPIGSLILNMTDQTGNEANLACTIQRPSKMSPVMLDRSNGHTLLRTSFSTFLVCNIDYDHIQKLWGILAMYSDSPMKLRQELLLTKAPYVSYTYKQVSSEDEVFTNIEAELRAEPSWVMQEQITLQLDRTATTLNTLHVRYIADARIVLEQYDEKPLRYKWAMILKDNTTQTEHSVVTGGTVELDCQVIGEPTPVVEWILPDGSKVRAPYNSEEGRIIITKSGKFILRAVDSFDTGVYHCIGTNYHDADVLTFRIVVVNPDVEHETLNGAEISPFTGESLSLPCHSSGIPDASVTWILPDNSVINYASKHKNMFPNGTLNIQELTERDRGYFRCVAANAYGFDVLVVKVLTQEGVNYAQSKGVVLTEDWVSEGSGNEELTDVTEHYVPLTTRNEDLTEATENYVPLTTTQSLISETSTGVSKKEAVSRQRVTNESKIQFNKRGNKPSKQTRGQRRQFNHGSRRIDPQRWAALLEKTKRKSVPATTKESITANMERTQVNNFAKLSGDGEEMSGDDFLPTEEGFLILTTKMPKETTTSQLSLGTVTKGTQLIFTTHSQTTPSVTTEEIPPVLMPMVIDAETSEPPNSFTDGIHATTIQTEKRVTTLQQSIPVLEKDILGQELTTASDVEKVTTLTGITKSPTMPVALNVTTSYPNKDHPTTLTPLNVTLNEASMFPSTGNHLFNVASTNMNTMAPFTTGELHFTTVDMNTQNNIISDDISKYNKLTPETPNEDVSTYLPTSQKTTDKRHPPYSTSAKSSLERDLMAVTETENEIGHVYFQTTQHIIAPGLPPGSTIITHQQIQIIRDVTPNTPNSKQHYGRRRISGKRRIVRPDRIPNIKDRYPFFRPERKESISESTTVTSATELATKYEHSSTTPPLVVPVPLPTPSTRQNTSQKMYSQKSTVVPIPEVTDATNKVWISEPDDRRPKSTHTYEEMIKPKTKTMEVFESTVSSPTYTTKGISLTSAMFLTNVTAKSVSTTMSPSLSTQGSKEYVTVQLKPPTAKSRTSSKTLKGKIPWHRFIGNGQIQKEILRKLRKPKVQTPRTATTMRATESLIPASTLPVSVVVPSSLASASENITGMPVPLTKTSILDDDITLRPTRMLSSFTAEIPPSTQASSLAMHLIEEVNTNSHIPTSTMTVTITGGSFSSSETTAFYMRASNAGKRKGVKRKRPRKKTTTQQSTEAAQWKVSAALQEKGSSQMTTPFYTPTTSSMPLASQHISGMATAMPYLVTSQQQPLTASVKTERRTSTKASTTTPASKPPLKTDTTVMTVCNTLRDILSTKKPLTHFQESTTYYNPLTKRILLPSESPALNHNNKSESMNVGLADSHETYKNEIINDHYTEAMPTTASQIITSTRSPTLATSALYPNVQTPAPLSPVVTATPLILFEQSTSPQQWQKRIKAVPEMTEKSITLKANPETIFKKAQSLTSDTPVINSDKYPRKNHLQNKAKHEATTMRQLTTETLPSDRPRKPKILGGKVASFTVLANSDAFIPCEASGNPVPTIHWTKVSSGSFLLKSRRGNKLEIFVNGTLSIPNVSIHDRGQYLCIAANQYGSDRLLVTLSVVAYPPRILEGRSKEITVHSGKSVEVKCQAEGRPIPAIMWILANRSSVSEYSSDNDRVSVSADGTLTIKEVTIYDRGLYKCLASNQAGSDTLSVKVQVIAAPPIILEDKRERIEGMLGDNLKLPCTARGNPNPTVHWVIFDGTLVKPLHFINAKLFMFSNGSLYIRNLASDDSGIYECIATSSTGSERRVITLNVEQKDTIPKIVTASPKFTERSFGDQLLLNCSATGEPKPRIIWRLPSKAVVDQWHRMGNRIQVYPNGSLFVDAVTEKDAGDYLCVARNKIGDDLILMRVSVTLKPAKIDQKQYFKKQVPYGKDFKVDCKASGSPMPEISWSLPDGTMINNVLQADDNGRSRFRRYILFENGTLSVNKVGITEEGDYTCVAQNTLGKDEMKVHITVVTAAPRIKQNYKTHARVKAGETATFDCEAIGEPRPRTFWLLPTGDMISASSDRYLLHVNGSLSISKVKLLDAGEYMCVARNPAGDDTKLYKLEVVSRPPLINGLYTNKTVIKDTAVKHSRKFIECTAEGTPPPQVMWIMPDNIFLTAPYYGSRIIVHKNGTLEIRNVRASDTAEFICVARNDGGETVLVVQLEALDMLRRPMFKNPFNEKITARPDKTATLNCSADGNPLPEMVWLLPNGTRFSSDRKLSRYQMGSDGTFIIHSPTKEDAGKYRCAARNIVGYIEKLIILEVGQKPTILTHPRRPIKGISGEHLSLHCLSDGVPKPSIIWTVPSGFVIDRPQITGRYILHENGTLVVREASAQDRGNYICRAQNNAGDTAITVPVMIIAYAPKITNRPPQSMRTRAGAAVQLNCVAIGIPKPEILWELPDRSTLSTASKGRPSGSELLHPQGTLVIQNPRISDSGTYRCTAKNSLGSDVSATYIQVI